MMMSCCYGNTESFGAAGAVQELRDDVELLRVALLSFGKRLVARFTFLCQCLNNWNSLHA